MIFGFNTDVHVSNITYHVQTEDRGTKNPVVDSVIYVGGKIVDRVQTPYNPEAVTEAEIEAMVRRQHRELLESIRSGTFTAAPEPLPLPLGYGLRLVNQSDIVRDGQLLLEFRVWNRAQSAPAPGASLDVRWSQDGEAPQKMLLRAGSEGEALVSIPAPESGREITLLVCVKGDEGREIAKFRVRGKTAASDQ